MTYLLSRVSLSLIILICFFGLSECCWNATGDLQITGLNLNFTAYWNPCPGQNITYKLTVGSPSKELCVTTASECFLGGTILENEPFPPYLSITLSDGSDKIVKWIDSRSFTVGRPDIESIQVEARNARVVIRGPRTPLYSENRRYRGSSFQGDKSPIYMGQNSESQTRNVECSSTLTTIASGTEVKLGFEQLDDRTARLVIPLTGLTPHTNYQLETRCRDVTLTGHESEPRTLHFTTGEDVPAKGPSVLRLHSVGLGCEEPDLRNITMTIQAPPVQDHNGYLTLYDIQYRHTATTSQTPDDGGWESVVWNWTVSVPPSVDITVPSLSRWVNYEIRVFANNSAGGASSSIHQLEILRLGVLDSALVETNKTELGAGVWLLKWDTPQSVHTGDCIVLYNVSADGVFLASVNGTSYVLDMNVIGPVSRVSITPMIYNGTGPYAQGIASEIDFEAERAREPLVGVLAGVLLFFTLVIIVVAYVCVKHGPRWTGSLDIRNNAVLKAAFAMGEIRPVVREKEEFDTLVAVVPQPPQAPADGSGGDSQTSALLGADPEGGGGGGGDAAPHPLSSDHTPPVSEDSSVAGDGPHDGCVPMETDADDNMSRVSSENNASGDTSLSAMSGKPAESLPQMSCSEDSLMSTTPISSYSASGYVTSPPPYTQHPTHNSSSPNTSTPYFAFSTATTTLVPIRLDNEISPKQEANLRRCCHDDLGTMMDPTRDANGDLVSSERITRIDREPTPAKRSLLRLSPGMQTSLDSVGTTTTGESSSPQDSDAGEGVDCYTKLSQPNTPLSPRSKGTSEDSQAQQEEEEQLLYAVQSLVLPSDEDVEASLAHLLGLSNVG